MNFEELSLGYQEKNIVKLSKMLAKSCSLTKSKDMSALCELAYRLYLCGATDEIRMIYDLTNVEIPEKINYDVWTWILCIWGLQAYIDELNHQVEEKDNIVAKMKKVYSVPARDGQTEEEAWKFFQKIASRQTYAAICKEKEIERSIADNDKKSETSCRFIALYNMISYGVTGFYPALENNKEQLKQQIEEYMDCLRGLHKK